MSHQFIDIHTHQKSVSKQSIAVRNAYLCLTEQAIAQLNYLVSVGLHPWHINKLGINEATERLINCSSLKNVFAIGEIGIDRAIDVSLSKQIAYFEAQLNIARAVKKPVIIHAVKSYGDIIPFLKKSAIPFIFHQFMGNEQQAKELLKLGAFLSFGKNLFYEKSALAFKHIPIDQVFLETDNAHQITIENIYNQAALIKGMEVDALKSLLFFNFTSLNKS